MMDREDAIKKIKKCMALSKSANEHEAAAAMRQAQKLMAELGMDETDLQMTAVGEASSKAASNAAPEWEVNLANLVASAFGCQLFLSRELKLTYIGSVRYQSDYHFIGVSPAEELAVYAFQVLQRQCVKARTAHIAKQPGSCKPITKTARGDSFARGWVYGVRGLVERFAQKAEHEELLLTYMEKNHPNLGSAKVSRRDVGRNIKDDAWEGRKAGSDAQLNRAMTGGKPQTLLGR